MNPITLSPLNRQSLVAALHTDWADPQIKKPVNSQRPKAIECWKCPECGEIHEWEDEAIECCEEEVIAPHHESAPLACPICATAAHTHRDAADCCLWKDIDAHKRWAMADRVEAGETWAEVLGVH